LLFPLSTIVEKIPDHPMQEAHPRVVMRLSSVLLILFAVAIGFTGCQPDPTARKELVLLNGAEPESLDPAIITGQSEGRILTALFEGLTSRDPHGVILPGVAESWAISPDGREYRFRLRKEARWSNGDPVVADDFIQSWKRTLEPQTAAEYAYQLFYLKNAEDYNSGKLKDFTQVGVHSPDPHTLIVQLSNPTPFFLDLCAFATLMPIHPPSVAKHGDEWIKPGHLISNGPYELVEWRLNHRLRVKANPHYWDRSSVGVETVDFIPTTQANTAYNLYYSGAADVIWDKGLVPPMLLSQLKTRPDFHSSPFLGNYFYRFNVTRKPFNDARVRKAFALVVDKDLLVTKITRAGERPADSLVPPGIPGYESPAGLSRDPQTARTLLAEAGYPEGKGFPVVSLLFNRSELNEAIATEIQAMLKKELSVQIELRQQETKVYYTSMSQLDYDFCRASWVGDYNDPNTFLDMFVTGGGNNRTGWSNAAYDALIRKAAGELDPAHRMKIFQEAEKILCTEELPILPLYYYVGIQLYDEGRIAGIAANVLDDHPVKHIHKLK
jgi:oligopeptide transport system substrate-binding protein